MSSFITYLFSLHSFTLLLFYTLSFLLHSWLLYFLHLQAKECTSHVRIFLRWKKNLYHSWICPGGRVVQTINSAENFLRRNNSKVTKLTLCPYFVRITVFLISFFLSLWSFLLLSNLFICVFALFCHLPLFSHFSDLLLSQSASFPSFLTFPYLLLPHQGISMI